MSRPILERLRDPHPEERRRACRDAVDDPSAALFVEALTEALGDGEKAVARAASDSLVQLSKTESGVANALRGALRDRQPSRRWAAALTLSRIQPPSTRLLPVAVEALASEESDVRWAAARLLVTIGRLSGEVMPLLLGLLRGSEANEVRRGAAKRPQKANEVRRMATFCLRELAPERPEAARVLLEATRDPEIRVRRAALTALAALTDPPPEVFERLLEAIIEEGDTASRRIATFALGILGTDQPARLPKSAISQLEQIAATNSNEELGRVASHVLQQLVS